MSVPRMRTIKECADYFKQEDPETKITYWNIRTWVLEGRIPHIKAGKTGKTRLVNLDILIDMVNSVNSEACAKPDVKQPVKLIGKRRIV